MDDPRIGEHIALLQDSIILIIRTQQRIATRRRRNHTAAAAPTLRDVRRPTTTTHVVIDARRGISLDPNRPVRIPTRPYMRAVRQGRVPRPRDRDRLPALSRRPIAPRRSREVLQINNRIHRMEFDDRAKFVPWRQHSAVAVIILILVMAAAAVKPMRHRRELFALGPREQMPGARLSPLSKWAEKAAATKVLSSREETAV